MIIHDDSVAMSRQRFLLLLFDLPVKTRRNRSAYRRFKKLLKQDGYIQLQKSIYLKTIRNYISIPAEAGKLKSYVSSDCDIKLIPLTFSSMGKVLNICGEPWPFEELGKEMVVLSDDLQDVG